MSQRDGITLMAIALILNGLFLAWYWAIFHTPSDAHMGEVYRIIYLHVPAAISSFVLAYILLGASLWSLRPNSQRAIWVARSSAEVGLIFTIITLITGSIWGYPTWGVWWTWDARITTTFLLALMLGGYLLLFHSIASQARRTKVCAVLAILIAVDVPIIYKSVTWWRTLHQPPSIMREGGSTMDPTMLAALGIGMASMLFVVLAMVMLRSSNLILKDHIERESLTLHS